MTLLLLVDFKTFSRNQSLFSDDTFLRRTGRRLSDIQIKLFLGTL